MNINIDWALLRQQKKVLLEVINIVTPNQAEALTGILHLIDHLQDEAAANSEIGIKTVFDESDAMETREAAK